MKSYLVVFFVLWSFVGFGQENESNCLFDLKPTQGLIENVYCNHFEELFPSNKMKENKVKCFIIVTEDNNHNIPSIRVKNESYYKYILNNNGYVIHDTNGFQIQNFYERNSENQIIKITKINSSKDTSTYTYHYYPNRLSVVHYFPYYTPSFWVYDYFYDEENRFYGEQHRFYDFLRFDDSLELINYWVYDENQYSSLV